MKNKFIVCDPSIVGKGGHYLVYAEQVLASARDRSFQTHLFTNKMYSADNEEFYKIHRVFEYDIWGNSTVKASLKEWKDDADVASLLRARYSRLGLLWQASKDIETFSHYSADFPVSPRMLRRLRRMADIRSAAMSLLADREWEAMTRGHNPQVDRFLHYRLLRACIRDAASLVREDGKGRGLAGQTAAGAPADAERWNRLAQRTAAAQSFATALIRTVAALKPTADDHIFLPSMAPHELAGLRWAILQSDALQAPTYHLVFRRDIYRGYSDQFDAGEWGVHAMRHALHAMKDVSAQTRINFYTDTDELTYQYNRLDAFSFVTLPVPVSVEAGVGKAVALPELDDRSQRRVAILGNHGSAALAGIMPLLGRDHTASGIANFLVQEDAGSLPNPLLARWHPAVLTRVAVDDARWADVATRQADILILLRDGSSQLPLADLAAAGKLLVLPADAPECLQLCRQASQTHAALVASHGAVLAESSGDPNALRWRRYYESGVDREEDGSCTPEGVALTHNGMTYTRIAVSEGATHLWLKFPVTLSSKWKDTGATTELTVEFIGGGDAGQPPFVDQTERRVIEIFPHAHAGDPQAASRNGSRGQGEHSVLIKVPANSRVVWLALRNYTPSMSLYRLERFQVRWVRSRCPLPRTVGYIPYRQGRDFAETLNSIAQKLKEAIDLFTLHWDHGTPPTGLLAGQKSGAQDHSCLVGGYLGDARLEKGFHLIPAAIDRLDRDHVAPGLLRFQLQSYVPQARPELKILQALEHLRSMSRSAVRTLPRPLSVPEYNQLLDRSDFVLIPYTRLNYTARSSGIFTEALAAGKPVIVPAGTWMSEIVDQASYAFHAGSIEPDSIVSEQNCLQAFPWRTLSNDGDQPADRAVSSRSVRISRHQTTYIQSSVPTGCTHVWLSFGHDSPFHDSHTRVVVALLRDEWEEGEVRSTELWRRDHIVGHAGDERMSVVIPLIPQATRLWIGFLNAFTTTDYQLVRPTLRWLKSPVPIAETALGIKYIEENSDEEIARSLADAIAILHGSYASLNRSVAGFAPGWRERNAPSTLVSTLLAQSSAAPRWSDERISAQDW
ncbi:hypothetical protein ABNQ39_35575 (plasmid) [Azospirillum sp. A26]|uniref:hypothetical protein n=1 Tax=Azospirillum sp. A26 TaxID=3160607 RepID=UPI00366E6CD7